MSSTRQLGGKVVIVTGSVGNLGLATAQALQEAGAKTVLVDRSENRLQENYPGLIDSPDHFLAGGVDLTNPDSLARMVQGACERFGHIDALVNTEGGYTRIRQGLNWHSHQRSPRQLPQTIQP